MCYNLLCVHDHWCLPSETKLEWGEPSRLEQHLGALQSWPRKTTHTPGCESLRAPEFQVCHTHRDTHNAYTEGVIWNRWTFPQGSRWYSLRRRNSRLHKAVDISTGNGWCHWLWNGPSHVLWPVSVTLCPLKQNLTQSLRHCQGQISEQSAPQPARKNTWEMRLTFARTVL